ncbi:MAG: alpha/beta fold hydrolase [Opitutaceae bacterium]|nr:alpha/beta fold hydrolase [Opitutaceae bacterium]
MSFSTGASVSVAAEAGRKHAGNWAGYLTLPTGPLDIRVELDTTDGTAWQGAIDVPAQGVRGFKLKVTVAGSRVRFAMTGVPGDPTYTGTLSADGDKISGDYTQGGATFPFSLQRTTASGATAGPAIPAGVPGEGLPGHWLGVLKPTPNLALRVALEVGNMDPTQLEATLISIDQQNARMAASSVTLQEGLVRLEFRQPVAAFEGRLNGDGAELAGTWTQQNRRTPLTFKRQTKSAAPPRPQEPTKPYPYSEHEVTVENTADSVTLAGTLTVPRGSGPHPAAVLITGSGPQDRNQQVAGHRTFFVLADHLTRVGIAVLRCDDRGTGKSKGKFESALQSDFVADTLAAAAWLRARPEIDPRRVGLIGHSEGGMVAPRAAAKSPEIGFIVLLAAPGLPMEHIMIRPRVVTSRSPWE